MNEHLSEDLRSLAEHAHIPKIDIASLEAAAASRRRYQSRRRAGAVGALLVAVAGVAVVTTWAQHRDDRLVGTPAGPSSPATPCLPAPATVSPAVVRPGETVTLSAPPFTCAPYPPGKTYTVILDIATNSSAVVQEHELDRLPVNTDGAFAATITVPAGIQAGQGTFYLRGNNYDLCGGTPAGYGSCLGYRANPTITIRN